MNEKIKRWSRLVLIELSVAIVLAVSLSIFFLNIDAFESFYGYSRQHEDWELDEWIVIFLSLCVAGTILAIRHVIMLRHLMRELAEANEIIERQAEIKSRRDKLVALGELSTGLAHEINNALQPAIGLGNFIKEGLVRSGNVKHVAFMEAIMGSAQHAQHVIENILVFTQDRNPDLTIQKAQKVLKEAVLFGRDLMPTTIAFEISGLPVEEDVGSAWIAANKTSLCQIVLNLFKNASKAMNGGGRITVRYIENCIIPASGGVPAVQLEIEDMGRGIDEKDMGRVFDPFFTTRDISEGAGLGLSVVHGLVKQHQGHVSVRSVKGKGTIFTLSFPVCKPPPSIEE